MFIIRFICYMVGSIFRIQSKETGVVVDVYSEDKKKRTRELLGVSDVSETQQEKSVPEHTWDKFMRGDY